MKNNFRNKFSTSRQGFTLVELLVSMALILFIMSIISAVFVDSSESFRLFRGRMELSEKLRVITQTLRMDLRANHFGDGRKLSDNDFWDQGPPQIGYFRIEQKNPGFAVQSSDSTDQIITALPSDGHALLFSSFLYGGDNRGYFSTALPSTLGNSSTLGTFKFCRQNFLDNLFEFLDDRQTLQFVWISQIPNILPVLQMFPRLYYRAILCIHILTQICYMDFAQC